MSTGRLQYVDLQTSTPRTRRSQRALIAYVVIVALASIAWWVTDTVRAAPVEIRPVVRGEVTSLPIAPLDAEPVVQARIEGWRAGFAEATAQACTQPALAFPVAMRR